MAQIKFVQLSQNKYDDLLKKSSSTNAISASSLYFTTDTHRVYKGGTLYSNEVRLTDSLADVENPQNGCLYIITGETNKGDMYIYTNGDFSAVGMNTTKVAEIQGKISSNWSLISNNSSSIDGLTSRLATAESTLKTLGNLQNGESIADALANKLDKAEFSSYSSLTSSTLKDLRSDIDTNAVAISSNYNSISTNSVAIENVKSSISSLASSSAVDITEAVGSGDVLKVYTITQGGTEVGTINIPKDLVVTSGKVVTGTLTDGKFTADATGEKYIQLKIANQTDPIYIAVSDLVDVYTVQDTAEVNLELSSDNVISASIVVGSIAKTKLTTDVQASLDLADTAIQSDDLIYTNILSSANGETLSDDIATIKANIASLSGGVEGVQGLIDAAIEELNSSAVAATGSVLTGIYIENGIIVSSSTSALGSAAFTDSTAYDAAGAADDVKDQLVGSDGDDIQAKITLNALKNAINKLNVKIGAEAVATQIASMSASAVAAASSYAESVANAASTNAVAAANSYTDSALKWIEEADLSNE